MAPRTAPGKSHVINWIKNGFRCPQRPTFPDTIWSERDIGLWVIFGRILNLPLQAVPGVTKAVVSFADKTAVVTFDDAKTTVPALITATTNAGYPSAPKG
jgi:hypothetical protein